MPEPWEVTNDMFQSVLEHFTPKSEGTNTQASSQDTLKNDSERDYR